MGRSEFKDSHDFLQFIEGLGVDVDTQAHSDAPPEDLLDFMDAGSTEPSEEASEHKQTITFDEQSTRYAQKIVAPPKHRFIDFKIQ